MTDYIKGLDTASIQGKIDWQQAATSGVQFCWHRCFVGNDFPDPNYATNVQEAQAAGIKCGSYFFCYPLPTDSSHPNRDPKDQAALHDKAAGTIGQSLPACADIEWPYVQNWSQWNCSASQITQWLLTYLQEYERLSGVRPIIYSYPSFLEALNLPQSFADDYKLWIASYTTTPVIPKPFTEWTAWQTSGGTVKLPNGIPVDEDVMKDISLWDTTPVIPVPDPPISPTVIVIPPTPSPVVPAPPPTIPVVPTTQSSNWLQNLWQILSGFFK